MNEYVIIVILAALLILMGITFAKEKISMLEVVKKYMVTEHLSLDNIKAVLIKHFGNEEGLHYYQIIVESVENFKDEGATFIADKVNELIPFDDKKIDNAILIPIIKIILDAVIDTDTSPLL